MCRAAHRAPPPRAVAIDAAAARLECLFDLLTLVGGTGAPTALHQLRGDVRRFRLAAILQFTTIGIPVICYGEEVGRLGGDWPDNRSDMPWNGRDVLPGKGLPRDEELRRDYRRLIATRRAHAALWRGTHRELVHDGDLPVFARQDSQTGETVIVAVNRAEQPIAAEFPRPEGWVGRGVLDAWGQRNL